MKYHKNARLTVAQRIDMRREFCEGKSLNQLSRKYNVSTKAVQKWVHRDDPTDRSSAPHRRRSKRGGGVKSAVKRCKEAHPRWGYKRIAGHIRKYYSDLTWNRVRHILKANCKQQAKQKKKRRSTKPLPVGRHRVQIDIQQLPAVFGGSGYEYKISIIHMRTRIKYSEIHSNYRSKTVADVVSRALDRLPPFVLVWTDNAMTFTMRYTAYPNRRTAFQKRLMELKMIHGTCQPRFPWQNGIIERSHRTDNEEFFEVIRFTDPEERRYQLRLWEMYYAAERPHQGLGGMTPLEVYKRDYTLHAAARMII